MRLYESVCILHPSQTDEETGKVVEKMKEILERSGATIVKLENEGKKKLAYDIQHERRGTITPERVPLTEAPLGVFKI